MKTREQPCGRCNCGTYSIDASMNVKARKFGALDDKEAILYNIKELKKNIKNANNKVIFKEKK